MSGPSSADLKQRAQTLAAKGNERTFELAETLAGALGAP